MYTQDVLIRSQALRMLASGARKYIPAYILLPLVTVAVYWNHTAIGISLGWLITSLVVVLFRYQLIASIGTGDLEQQALARIEKSAIRSSLYSGILWCLAVFIFFNPEAVGTQLYLLGTIFCLSSTAVILCAWLPLTWYAFSIPVLGAVFVRLLLEGSVGYSGFAILTLLYFFAVMGVLKEQSKLAMNVSRLRFENLDLLEKLQKEKDVAEQANLAKSKFLAAASHDLRQPMHSIGLFSAALQNHTNNPDARRLINYIGDSVASLDNLLSVLLDISRLDAGVLVPRKTHFRLSTLLRKIENEYALQAAKKNLRWNMKVPGDIEVFTDEVLLETVLRNLLSNALRYTESGSIELVVDSPCDNVSICIADTGMGISLENQQAVFDEFFQVKQQGARNQAGLGLGLAIVKRIIQVLDCTLRLQSTPGVGTTFSIEVPWGDVRFNDARFTDFSDEEREVYKDCSGRRVLVIDNNPAVLLSTQALLQSWSCNVLAVSSATDAIDAVRSRSFTPDVVLTDYRLEDGKTCLRLVQQLRALTRVPFEVIVITGETAEQELRNLYSMSYALLHKPVKPEMLRALLCTQGQSKVTLGLVS